MNKTIIIYFFILLVGIILALFLPRQIASKHTDHAAYTVDSESLITPYLLSDMQLPSSNKEAEYTLRVGLFRKLGQATDKVETFQSDAPIHIIKAKDNQKEWFFILVGRYSSEFEAEQAKQELQDEGVSSTVSVWPATANNG
ncbi:SPOR domain-containing protein [Marinomonas posidonica]|uniref:Sporulation domain-containing protein n=1 Tax=Marinomonas posidonica (strain CECT 7376 / NCIMB 14433 / IVIA-Po-181) TaxID=491952 RepID=F6CX78_MARPP|nr:SPOR domain-containing protein [Marinomonas posidonica]AEF54431.1 Sporulation domain-containing protein [Marinomonas posidonica IVIA-Po-181]